MAWVRHHDCYVTGELADKDKPYWPKFEEPKLSSCCDH
jgi:hypothetical protein